MHHIARKGLLLALVSWVDQPQHSGKRMEAAARKKLGDLKLNPKPPLKALMSRALESLEVEIEASRVKPANHH